VRRARGGAGRDVIEPPPAAGSTTRSPVALTAAMNRDLQFRFRLATVAGLGAALATWLLTGYLRFDGEDSLETAAAGGIVFGVVTAAVYLAPYLVPREWRVLNTVFAAARRSARERRQAYGDPSVPATPRQATAWLARHPEDTDQTRGARVWATLVLGDLESAHRFAALMPDASAADRFHRATAEELIRVVEGADPALDEVRQRSDELDADDRPGAGIDIALLEALVAAADGRDWRAPILAIRGGLDGALGLVLLRWFLPVAALIAAGALAMTLIAAAFAVVVT
jgi:hypothetical protein